MSPRKKYCAACNQIIPKGTEYPKCSKCGRIYHAKPCSGLEGDFLKKGKVSRDSWKCPPCKTPKGSKVTKKAAIQPSYETAQLQSQSKGAGKRKATGAIIAPVTVSAKSSPRIRAVTETLIAQLSQTPSSFSPASQSSRSPVSPVSISPESKRQKKSTMQNGSGPSSTPVPIDTSSTAPTSLAAAAAVSSFAALGQSNDVHLSLPNITQQFSLHTQHSMSTPNPSDPVQSWKFMVEAIARIDRCTTEISTGLEKHQAEILVMKDEIRVVQLQGENRDRRLDKLEADVRYLQDYSRVNNLIVHGGPVVADNQQARTAVNELAEKVKVTIQPWEVETCHPLPSAKGDQKIICRFRSRDAKTNLQRAVRNAQLMNKDLHWGGQDRKVYCTDHLSPDSAALLGEAKAKLLSVNKGPCKYVWFKMGHVLTKVHDTAPVIEIFTRQDIEDLLQGRPVYPVTQGPAHQVIRNRQYTSMVVEESILGDSGTSAETQQTLQQ